MSRWLTPRETADKLGVYPHDLRRLVRQGMPAPSLRMGPRQPRYDEAALDAWMRGEDAAAALPGKTPEAAVSGLVHEILSGSGRSQAPGRRYG